MSPRKILFFIITSILVVILTISIIYISGQKKTISKAPASIKIWISNGTTESYKSLIEGFKKYAPEYKKTEIIIEKQPSDPDRYRTLLLSTLTEWNGPDIFMLNNWEDAILETKIEPIPDSMISISDFDKRYDDLFQDLLTSSGSWKNKKNSLKWVPLGYETLWIFYNKTLIREVPKTWNEIEVLYSDFINDKYPSNIGLGPIYTPNMIDILPLWLYNADTKDYSDASNNKNGIESYLNYGNFSIWTKQNEWESSTSNTKITLNTRKTNMLEEKLTTLDLFMQWDIAMIIGYPSLVLELEKSSKRSGSSRNNGTILTDRIPQVSVQDKKNIARYSYFGISKFTKEWQASLKFLEYLMTPDAQRIFMDEYPYLVPAQSEFYETAMTNTLSETLSRTKLAPFIPIIGDEISVFQYWLKSRFERYLREGIDTTENPDIESISTKISKEITCEISLSLGWDISKDCQKE